MAKLLDKLYNRTIEGKLTLQDSDDVKVASEEVIKQFADNKDNAVYVYGETDDGEPCCEDSLDFIGRTINEHFVDSANEGKCLVIQGTEVLPKRMPSRFEIEDIETLDSDFIDSLVLGDNLFQDGKNNYVLVIKDEDESEMCIFVSFNGTEIHTVYYQLTEDGWEFDNSSTYDIYLINISNLRTSSEYNGRVLSVGSGGRITTITKPTTLVRHNITCSNGSFTIINTTDNNYTTFNTLINADKMIIRLSGGQSATMTWASSEIILMYLDYENSEAVLKSTNLGSFVSDAIDYL